MKIVKTSLGVSGEISEGIVKEYLNYFLKEFTKKSGRISMEISKKALEIFFGRIFEIIPG